MVVLTIIVWVRMYTMRVAQMKRERIHPQDVATSAQSAAKLTDSRAADNFRNLFELPVLFYLALTVAAVSGLVTTTTLVRSEEHTSELQSLMRISYAVFCLKKQTHP